MNKKQQIIYIYLLLLPIIDVITSLMTRFSDFKLSLGMIIKGLTLIFSILYIIFFSKSRWRKKSITFLFIIVAYFIIYVLCKQEIFITRNYLTEITYAFKYSYFLIILLGIMNIFDDIKIENELIKKVFLISSVMYTALLLVPIITNTAFSSYQTADIAGDNGWFYAANETGAITVLLLLGSYYLLSNQNKWHVLGYIPILLSIALIGTKVSYIGMIIAIITIAIFNVIKNKKDGLISSILLIAVLIIVCDFSPAMSNLAGTNERIEENKKKIDYKINDYIHNETLAKIVMLGLNGREDFFINDLELYGDEDTLDKFFGLGWSNCAEEDCDYDNKLVEIDYLDIFFHYGIIGFIIYFIPLIYILIYFFKRKKTIDSYYYFIFLLLGLLISSIAGHVLAAPAVSIYLALIIYMMDKSYNYELNDKEITIMALHLGHGGIEKYISSLCKMLDNDYKINIITTYKLAEKPAFNFSEQVNITYLIDGEPNKQAFIKALKEKNIKNIFKEGIVSIKTLYHKRKKNIAAIKKINSKYIITTRDFHNALVGEYAIPGIVKIATEHNYHNNNKKYYLKVANSVRGFDYFVLVSQNLCQFYENKVLGPKCIYIPNTIDELPKEETKLNNNNLIAIGRLVKEKGFDDLIDVIKLVKAEMKDIKLYLIGDGPLKESLEAKVRDNKLTKNIILTGYKSQKEIAKYMIDSKLYLMTSHTESFGIVLLEAMSYQVPCIAFDTADGAKELLKNDIGILIQNRDKQKMADEIIKLLNNKKELTKYSKAGYKKCHEYLTENVKNKWLAILK